MIQIDFLWTLVILVEGYILWRAFGDSLTSLRLSRQPKITFQPVDDEPVQSQQHPERQSITRTIAIVEDDTEDFDLSADFATPVMPMPGTSTVNVITDDNYKPEWSK